MSRLFKNFAKKFMHGECSTSGGGGGGGGGGGSGGGGGGGTGPIEEIEIDATDITIGVEEIFEHLERDENVSGGRGVGDARGGGVSSRSRRGTRIRSGRLAALDVNVDPNLSGEKVLSNFRALPADEVHVSVQTGMASRNLRGRGSLSKVLKFYNKKIKNIPAVVHFLEQVGFIHFLGIRNLINADIQLCSAIALRWYKTTHTFHFQCGELGITPFDFSMLTGLSINSALPPLPYDEK